MRSSTVLTSVLALALLASPSAHAADAMVAVCLPSTVMLPAYTPEGQRVGTVVARVRLPYPQEISRFTGQPRAVVFNDPGSMPGAVDPGLEIVPLRPYFHSRPVSRRGH